MQVIVTPKMAHENIIEVHIPLYGFGAMEGLSNKISTIHQLQVIFFMDIVMPFNR